MSATCASILTGIVNDTAVFATASGTTEPSTTEIVFLSIGVVFAGLLLIIVVISVMSAIVRAVSKNDKDMVSIATETQSSKTSASVEETIPHGELVAIIAAAIATEIGTDVSGLRIHSIKKLSK